MAVVTPKLAVMRSEALVHRHLGLGELLAQALGLGEAIRLAAAGEQNQELLAAVAPNGIVLANAILHAAGRLPKNRIASQMSVSIVDVLEVIQIHDHNAQGTGFALRTGQLAAQFTQDGTAVPQARERIPGGLLAQIFPRFQQLRLQIHQPGTGPQAELVAHSGRKAW